MSNADALTAKRDSIAARSAEDNKKIDMPFANFLQEAETAWVVAQEDQSKLESAGLNWTRIAELPEVTGAVRQLQSLWTSSRNVQTEAEDAWDDHENMVIDHKEICIHAMGYAYRNDEDLLAGLDLIIDGEGPADLVQDMNDISVSGLENDELFHAINFDMANFTKAAELGDYMADLLAKKQSSPEMSEIKVLRDKGYSWLKELLEELYSCGQYVFWKDKARKKLYSSEYQRSKSRRNYLARKRREAVEEN